MTRVQNTDAIRDAYNTWSATYDQDRNLTRDLDARVTRAVLGGHRVSTTLELGCGTGKNTPFLTRIAGRVIAVDFSERMIRTAKAKLTPPTPVSFLIADLVRSWPVGSASVQLISINLVLEHVPALGPFFSEAARVLQPAGHLFICELHPFRQYQGRRAVFRRGTTKTEIPAFVHHISTFVQEAESHSFALRHLREWWHGEDSPSRPPRVVSFLFEKDNNSANEGVQ